MEQSELLRFVVAAVERLSLRYFVTGSTVTIFYGEPRFTNDIDIVVDVIPANTAFNQSRFQRARRVQAGQDWDALLASPEDAIVKKMESFREGGSEKHLRDIAGVLKTSGAEMDRAYIEQWAARLGVSDVWERILDRAGRQE